MGITDVEKIADQINFLELNHVKNQAESSGADFAEWIEKELSLTADQINTAEQNLRDYAVGEADNLHQVMMSLEKAKSSFELVVEVRNKLLEGYQQIMRMQV